MKWKGKAKKMFFKITCSNCGKHRRLSFPMEASIYHAIACGWNSFGSALYCPDCVKTWHERNNKELAGERNTHDVIEYEFHYAFITHKWK
jgi:hypothetical protein